MIKKIINKIKKQYLENKYIYEYQTWSIYMDLLFKMHMKKQETKEKNIKEEKITKIIDKIDKRKNKILYKIWEII